MFFFFERKVCGGCKYNEIIVISMFAWWKKRKNKVKEWFRAHHPIHYSIEKMVVKYIFKD